METEAGSGPQTDPPAKKANKLFLFCLFLLFIVAVLIAYVLILLNKKQFTNLGQSSRTETAKPINLPNKNIIIYTRCYGGEKQPKYCNLYASSLKEPEETLIYSFGYPAVEQTDFESSFGLVINGVINKRAIYTKSFWEKKNNEQIEYSVLGEIDLATGGDSIVYRQTHYPPKNSRRDERDNGHIVGVYLDAANNRVLYTTELGPGSGGTIAQYDLATKQTKVVADEKKLGGTYKVEYANKDKLYLSSSNDYIAGNYSINKIFDLTSGATTDTPKPWYNGVINKQGTMVAYVEQTPIEPEKTFNLRLETSDLQGKNFKEIYAAPNTRLPADGYNGSYPYTYVNNYYFNEYGDTLSYTVHKTELVDGKYADVNPTNYISFLEVRKAIEKSQKGIQILPLDNPDIYKTKYIVKPPNINYRWAKFHTLSGLFEGNSEEAVYYEADKGWYLRPIGYGFNNNEFDLYGGPDDRQVIAANAQNLYIIPD